ncbi:transmembrane protein 119 isoform X2 [Pseudorca crassidens]|uniref:transmembrane protein 119 isoform X2 n=2 Tax=Pseudorca crassidens TaxID=82174 RepID=UPI00352C1BC0
MVSELGSEESPCSQLGVPDSHVVPLLAIHTVPATSISRPNNSPGRWPYPHCTDVDTEAQRGDLPGLKTHSWEVTSSQAPGSMVSAAAPSLTASLLLLLRVLPTASYSVSLRATFLEDTAGSGEAEGASASSPSLPPPRTPALSLTSVGPQLTPLAGPKPPTNFLDGIVDFFRQYVMLIAVVGSLVFLLLFTICAALITRQKHKASAYYPSSFPKKKYVDQSDRAGGPRAFSEVPDRAPDGRPDEARDSSQQLQADILAATQNLKSPARAALGMGDGARMMEGKSEEEEKGSREADQEAQGHGVPAEKPEAPPEEPCSAQADGAVAAAEGQGEPEAAPSLALGAAGPAGSLENPCACGSVPPSI